METFQYLSILKQFQEFQKENLLILETEILNCYQKRKILNEVFSMKQVENLEFYCIKQKWYLSCFVIEVENEFQEIVAFLLQKQENSYLVTSYQQKEKKLIEYQILKGDSQEQIREEINPVSSARNLFYFSTNSQSNASFENICDRMQQELLQAFHPEELKVYPMKKKK